MTANWKEIASPVPYCRAFAWGYVRVIVGQEPGIRWHLSISRPDKNPTWEEIRQARYDLVPDDVTMAMILPPRAQYVNIHQFCFHLHEIDRSVVLQHEQPGATAAGS